uniref:Uncharacterized protein n=1 Tax=Diplocarpon coronariae TaxID=2795749 RepID=A0A891IR90_9HELO|nr:hypothetical protein 2 [Marssonina coronariae]
MPLSPRRIVQGPARSAGSEMHPGSLASAARDERCRPFPSSASSDRARREAASRMGTASETATATATATETETETETKTETETETVSRASSGRAGAGRTAGDSTGAATSARWGGTSHAARHMSGAGCQTMCARCTAGRRGPLPPPKSPVAEHHPASPCMSPSALFPRPAARREANMSSILGSRSLLRRPESTNPLGLARA